LSGVGVLDRARAIVRIPVKASNVPILDGWRGLCILLVLVGHFVTRLEPLAAAGVELFFVLSGRLMAEILILRRQPIAQFLKRRAARILPALLCYVVTTAAAVNLILWLNGGQTNWISPLAALLFVHNYIPPADILTIFEHCWSLAVEEHSYLTLVLVALLARRNPRAAMLIAIAISLLAVANGLRVWDILPDGGQYYLRRSDVRIASVLLSFAACLAVQRSKLKVPALASPVAALAALLLVAHPGPIHPLRMAAGSICGAIAVNTLDVSPERLRKFLSTPLLVWFGTLSYSLYLWQQMLFVRMHAEGSPLLAAALAVGFALVSFKYIEQPAREFLNSRWDRKLSLRPSLRAC
jgi:peptidoglycan/LPS O-acetylase OafA/YrhL